MRAGLASAGMVTAGILAPSAAASAALPTFTLSQAIGLVPAQTITVSWAHQLLGPSEGAFAVFQCAGLFDPADYYRSCDELALQDPAKSSGSVDVVVHQQFIPDDLTLHVCNGIGAEQCYVVLVASETLAVHGSLPILFLGPSSK